MTPPTMIPTQSLPKRFGVLPRRALSFTVALIGVATGCAQPEPAAEKRAWEAFSATTPPAETIRYASTGSDYQQLEIYPPAAEKKSGKPQPVLLLVHGGGWSGGSREALAPHARYFAALGWACVNVSYRLTSVPGVTISTAQEDVRAAFDWIRREAPRRGWDATRISALGESAGGQLVCALGLLPPDTKRWRARSLVLINPVLDLTTLPWALTLPGVREGGPVNPATVAQHPAWAVSPLFHLSAESPPMLVLHGRKDTSVPIAQAETFAAAAAKAGAKVELVVLENMAHAFLLRQYGDPDTMRTALKRIAQFLGEP